LERTMQYRTTTRSARAISRHRDFAQNVFGFRRTEGTRKQAHYKNGPKVNKSGEIPKRKAVM